MDILKELNQKTNNEDIFISNHAKVRMIERGISTLSIKSLINNGEIIEQYSDDIRTGIDLAKDRLKRSITEELDKIKG